MGDLVARVRIPARWGEAGHDRRAFAWVVVARPKHKAMVMGIVLVLPLLGHGRALRA
jgi:hypothetical protein